MFGSMDAKFVTEQRRLMGLPELSERRSALKSVLGEAFPHDLHSYEAAHYTGPEAHVAHSTTKFQDYHHKSGVAHHHGHIADQMTAMIKSGELHGDKLHHENARKGHNTAMSAHNDAAVSAREAGNQDMSKYHVDRVAHHERQMGVHSKKLRK